MANHKSAIKRIRANAAKRLRNRYQAKTTRNAIKKLRNTTDATEAKELSHRGYQPVLRQYPGKYAVQNQ